jgi:conjugal transfer/entry exclusion protein
VTITVNDNKVMVSQSQPKKLSYILSGLNKYLFLVCLLLIIGLGILIGFLVVEIKKTHRLTDDVKIANQLNNLLSEKNKTIEELNHQLREIQNARSKLKNVVLNNTLSN